MTLPDEEALFAAVWQALKPERLDQVRVAVVDDTLHLEQLWLSENLLGELENGKVETVGDSFPLEFDAQGRMLLDS